MSIGNANGLLRRASTRCRAPWPPCHPRPLRAPVRHAPAAPVDQPDRRAGRQQTAGTAERAARGEPQAAGREPAAAGAACERLPLTVEREGLGRTLWDWGNPLAHAYALRRGGRARDWGKRWDSAHSRVARHWYKSSGCAGHCHSEGCGIRAGSSGTRWRYGHDAGRSTLPTHRPCRRIFRITLPCVMAAMIRSAPCGHHGQRAISSAKTRFSSRAQLQRGDSVLASGSSMPCWRGVGVIALRKPLWGAKQPPEPPRAP
jgi:hypothetical protein